MFSRHYSDEIIVVTAFLDVSHNSLLKIEFYYRQYTIARFTRIFDETFDYAQGKKDAKWFGCLGKTEEKLAFLLALAMH